MTNIRTRIAPSPTGFAHVGTAYVCLLNYAFTRKNGGKLILRVDDSDTKRHVEGAENAIYAGLSWLGFDWDEGPDKPADRQGKPGEFGPYRPSEKLDIYKAKAGELIKKGQAFEDEGAIRFKNTGQDQTWRDLIRGEIKFGGGEITDFVIVKSDGYPTYNFNTVVDDIDMQITHVIRGEEHISNTPRQLALYQAFGVKPPEFAHFPTLRNADRKKLSKRRDPVDLRLYREAGYLPQALVNFLGLLGWSHPEGKEVFDLAEFVDKFDLSRVSHAGPIFDTKKLDWLNGLYIRSTSDAELAKMLNERSTYNVSEEMAALVRERISKLSEADSLLDFFVNQPVVGRDLFEGVEKSSLHVITALHVLSNIKDWNLENINSALTKLIEEKGFKTGDFYMTMRLVLTGKRMTPPINESMVILGQDEVLQRLEEVQKVLIEIEPPEIG